MEKYRRKPVTVDVLTFDELVEYGINNGANIVNGMPWSFKYLGYPVTHESDDHYIITTMDDHVHLERGEVLIFDPKGSVYSITNDSLRNMYEAVENYGCEGQEKKEEESSSKA